MKMKCYRKLAVISCLSLSVVCIGAAQDGPKSRSVKSEDFTNQRPERPRPVGIKRLPKPTPRTYKHTRTEKNRWKKPGPMPPSTAPLKVTEVGVTVWKMRPPRKGEVGHFLPVKDETGTRRSWLAERVGTDAVFKIGDKVRFAVESSDSGYLYIIDRETFSDGTFGAPELIFPQSESDDNSIGPGMLFDLPDQREDDPYFILARRNKGNAALTGDMLTIVISPKPLTIFKTGEDGKLKNDDQLVAMESATEVEIFSRTDTTDRIFSNAESEASCGKTTRGLAREKSANKPCGTMSRQLFREESAPQALYRVKGLAGQPAVAFVRLALQP